LKIVAGIHGLQTRNNGYVPYTKKGGSFTTTTF